MPDRPPPAAPAWKQTAVHVLATWTPLRWMPVRERASAAKHALMRADRRRRERRGDWSRSQPALFGMDVRLGELLGSDGVFVEAGGYDGYTQSNTYYLERAKGWRGLVVEPVPALNRIARRNRPGAQVVRAALTDPAGSGSNVRMHFGGLMSVVAGVRGDDEADRLWIANALVRGIDESYEVVAPGRTLSELIDEAGLQEIDLLSLDLEGFEPTALRGLDLDRHGPRYLLVEAHEPRMRAEIEAVLGDRYVHVERFSEMDDLYRRADVAAPGDGAAAPGAQRPLAGAR